MDQHRWDDEADDKKPAPKGERPNNEGGFEDDDSQLKFFGSGGQRSGPPRPQGGGYGPRDDRGGYQRRDDRGGSGGGYQRRDDRGGPGGGYQRRDDRGGYQPRDDRGGYQRRDDRGGYGGGGGGYQRRDDRGGYTPRDDRGGYQRRDDRGGFTPRDDRGGAGGGGYQRRDDRGGYQPRDDRGGYQRRDDRGGYTPRDDRGGTGGYQRRDDRGGPGGGGYQRRDDRGGEGGGYQRRDDRGGEGGGYQRRDDRGGYGGGGGGYQRRDDRGGYGGGGGYQRRDDRGGYGGGGGGGYQRRDDRGGYGRRDDRGRTFRSRSGGAPDEHGRRRFDPNRRQRVDRDMPPEDGRVRQREESPLSKKGPGTTLVKAMVSYQFGSRMLALKAIEDGRVTVNDHATTQPNTFIRLDRDVITVDQEELQRKSVRPIYIVFHKPMGLIGSKEEFRRNLYSYLTNRRGWTVPIGVLPRAASGIVIVTNDRAHRAADASFLTNLSREYQLKLHRAPKKTEITKLQKALREKWKGHESSTEVELVRTTARAAWIAVRSTTGSLNDITKICHDMGLEPLRIERTRVGPFATEALAAGAWYRLSAPEVDTLNAFAQEAQPSSASAAQTLWQSLRSRLFDVDAED